MRVDLGVMGMKGFSVFPKTPVLLETHLHIVVSYSGHSLRGSYPSTEKQSVYSTAPADWARAFGLPSTMVHHQQYTHTHIRYYTSDYIYIYTHLIYTSEYIYTTDIHHHHHVVPPARISLTFSRNFSLSFIASGRSSELHPVSSHSCCM